MKRFLVSLVTVMSMSIIVGCTSKEEKQLLIEAIESADVLSVNTLLDKGVSPNFKYENEKIMDRAIYYGNDAIILLMNEKKGEFSDNGDLITMYLQRRLSPSHGVPFTLENEQVMKLLTDRITDINQKNEVGMTPLMMAFSNGMIQDVKIIEESGGDFNILDNDNCNVLFYAVDSLNQELLKYALDRVEEKWLKNKYGDTVLHYAVTKQDPMLINLLIKAGAPKNEKNDLGETVLDIANQYSNREIIEILKK